MLIYSFKPNHTIQIPGQPGDTQFHQITPPSGVILGAGLEVAINVKNTAGTGAGSVISVNFNQTSSPTTGFAVLPGQTLVLSAVANLWVAQSVASDVLTLLWSW